MAAANKGRILVIEDEKQIAEIVKAYLDKDGYLVNTAHDGETALKLFKDGYDLVILDLMLPDISGEDLCGIFREQSDIPIIMLTAKSAEEDRIHGLGIGADDYVVKPFSPRELVARVAAHLRRTKKTDHKLSFEGGALVLDEQNHEIELEGKQLQVTRTEFGILHALAEKPGRVLSRLQLVNIVQGYDFEGYERTIDAHVKNLRQKLEEDPRNPRFVKTVYGVGYKFIGKRDAD